MYQALELANCWCLFFFYHEGSIKLWTLQVFVVVVVVVQVILSSIGGIH
jgi:hypothetical protein